MNVPVSSILPRNTLPPMALAHKFRASLPGMRGLGECYDVPDESGGSYSVCYDPASDPATIPTSSCIPGVDPNCSGPVAIAGQSNTGVYMDAGGDIVIPDPTTGGYKTLSPGGTSSSYPAGSSLPPSSSGTITPQQAQAYATVINSLSSAANRALAISSLPAGATLLPNGTIVGAGQAISSGGVNLTGLTSLFGNPIFLVALIGIPLMIALEK